MEENSSIREASMLEDCGSILPSPLPLEEHLHPQESLSTPKDDHSYHSSFPLDDFHCPSLPSLSVYSSDRLHTSSGVVSEISESPYINPHGGPGGNFVAPSSASRERTENYSNFTPSKYGE